MNLDTQKLRKIKNASIICSVTPKISSKNNIYFLSRKRVEEKKKKEKVSKSIAWSLGVAILAASYFYTN